MTTEIQNSTVADTDEIVQLYKWATDLQKQSNVVPWPVFERTLIENDIAEKRHWKMVHNNEIACIWTITFSDPFIWDDGNEDPAVYIHRIATRPSFRGNNLVAKIVDWAARFASRNGKRFIRMDTVGKNEKLINHYERCGFRYLGLHKLKNTTGLPAHYRDAVVSRFEIDLQGAVQQK